MVQLRIPADALWSLNIFQSLINDVLRDLLGICVIAYIDDILIYSPSIELHIAHIEEGLSRFWKYQLYVKAEKCKFHVTKVTFFDYVISSAGVTMDCEKVTAVMT